MINNTNGYTNQGSDLFKKLCTFSISLVDTKKLGDINLKCLLVCSEYKQDIGDKTYSFKLKKLDIDLVPSGFDISTENLYAKNCDTASSKLEISNSDEFNASLAVEIGKSALGRKQIEGLKLQRSLESLRIIPHTLSRWRVVSEDQPFFGILLNNERLCTINTSPGHNHALSIKGKVVIFSDSFDIKCSGKDEPEKNHEKLIKALFQKRLRESGGKYPEFKNGDLSIPLSTFECGDFEND